MLRGWDLPIQANISVSFNTKLILFNLVIAATPKSYSTYIYTDLRCRDNRPALPVVRRSPPARTPYRPITDPTKKSKISFLLG
jgi:hypothetical protein